MKKLIFFTAVLLSFSQASFAQPINIMDVQIQAAAMTPTDLINWTVGDTASYNVSAGSFGNVGTMVKAVTKDEGKALWVQQDMDLQFQKQKVEILIEKSSGKILKMLLDGKEQKVPDQNIEIISQDYTEITVPAGTFKVLHVVAKSKEVSKIEIWANPKETVMDGAVKQTIATGLIDITTELTSFKRGNK